MISLVIDVPAIFLVNLFGVLGAIVVAARLGSVVAWSRFV